MRGSRGGGLLLLLLSCQHSPPPAMLLDVRWVVLVGLLLQDGALQRGHHGGSSHGEQHTVCRGREVRSVSKNLKLQGEIARRAAWGRQPWGATHGL